MTSQQALVVIALALYCGRNHVGRNIWLFFAIRDSLKALKCVYPNGRKVGVLTRRRRIRQSLAGWVIFVLAQPVNMAADAFLYWFPFYSSLKMVIIFAFTYWRAEASALVFQSIVVPFFARYEEHIDLTLLLLGAIIRFGLHFLIEIPWATLTASMPWNSVSSTSSVSPAASNLTGSDPPVLSTTKANKTSQPFQKRAVDSRTKQIPQQPDIRGASKESVSSRVRGQYGLSNPLSTKENGSHEAANGKLQRKSSRGLDSTRTARSAVARRAPVDNNDIQTMPTLTKAADLRDLRHAQKALRSLPSPPVDVLSAPERDRRLGKALEATSRTSKLRMGERDGFRSHEGRGVKRPRDGPEDVSHKQIRKGDTDRKRKTLSQTASTRPKAATSTRGDPSGPELASPKKRRKLARLPPDNEPTKRSAATVPASTRSSERLRRVTRPQ